MRKGKDAESGGNKEKVLGGHETVLGLPVEESLGVGVEGLGALAGLVGALAEGHPPAAAVGLPVRVGETHPPVHRHRREHDVPAIHGKSRGDKRGGGCEKGTCPRWRRHISGELGSGRWRTGAKAATTTRAVASGGGVFRRWEGG